MKFKPTLLKTIISILFGILYFLYTNFFIVHCSDLPNRPCDYNPVIDLIISLIIILVAYLIWSLFEKKN